MRALFCLVALFGLIFLSSMTQVQARASDAVSPADTQVAEPIPYRQDQVIPPATLSRVLLAILLAILVGFISIAILKKYLFGMHFKENKIQRIKLIEARCLSPKLSLFLVQVDNTDILLVQTGEHVVSLTVGEEIKSTQQAVANE